MFGFLAQSELENNPIPEGRKERTRVHQEISYSDHVPH